MKPYNIQVVVQPGLEEMAEREINALGYKDLTKIKGGIFLKGHQSTIIKLNLACRTISRVLIEVADFEAKSFAQLEQHFGQIPWTDFLSGQKVCIHVSSYQSALYHEKAITERLITSLAEILGRTTTVVGSPDEENSQLISIFAKHDKFIVRMDSSGAHLHKRGYGIHKEDAPLRETIASAILMSLGWNETVFHLVDPLCGSGTIPIEAAMIARQIPLSEFRNFALQTWPCFQPDVYDKVRQELMLKVKEASEIRIAASDFNEKAVRSARLNAWQAGVNNLMEFEVTPLAEIGIDRNYAIVTNPPWGKRINDDSIHLIWKELFQMAKAGCQVYFVLPELQEEEFPYRFRTLLNFNSGVLRAKFIKLEA